MHARTHPHTPTHTCAHLHIPSQNPKTPKPQNPERSTRKFGKLKLLIDPYHFDDFSTSFVRLFVNSFELWVPSTLAKGLLSNESARSLDFLSVVAVVPEVIRPSKLLDTGRLFLFYLRYSSLNRSSISGTPSISSRINS